MTSATSPYETRKANTEARNDQIKQMVNELYTEHKLRYEIIRQRVCDTFFISPSTFYKIVQKPKQ